MTEEVTTEVETTEVQTDSLMGGTQEQEASKAAVEAEVKKQEELTPPDNGMYPHGFDATTYNAETREVKLDAVANRIKTLTDERANFEKQAQDFRKIVSKGSAPESIEDYNAYQPDSAYNKYYDFDGENNAQVKETLDEINKLSDSLGFNVEQNSKVKDFMNKTMEKVGVFDGKTAEQTSMERDNWVTAQREALGDNPERVINETKEFIESNPLFNDDQKAMLIKMSNTEGADFIKAMHAVHRRVNNSRGVVPPASIAKSTGRADLSSLAREYYNKDTSNSRRMEIAGSLRPGEKLPLG